MTTKLASLRSMMILASLALAACAGDDDDSDTNASATISTTIGSASNNSASATDDPTNASDTTDDPTDATVDPSAGTEDPGETTDTPADTGEECTAQDECIDDSMCAGGGMCIGCICIGGDDTGPTESDYGSCGACAPGEMPVTAQGLEDFCFCSPMCDGNSCPPPTSGNGQAVCALSLDMASMMPTNCAVPCVEGVICPDGATCEGMFDDGMGGTIGICTHPAG